MLEAEFLAGVTEVEGFVTTAVVGHDAGDCDAEACKVIHSGLEEGYGAFGFFVRQYLGEGDAGMIVYADVDELPTDAPAIALTGAIAGDAVARYFSKRPSFLMSMWIISPGASRS